MTGNLDNRGSISKEKGGQPGSPRQKVDNMLNIVEHIRASNTVTASSPVKHVHCENISQHIGPSVAKFYLEEKHFPGQREITAKNARFLAGEMTKGRFLPGTQIYLCVMPDGTEYLMNGRHRLTAVIASGKTQVFAVTRLYCSSYEEVIAAYSTFDSHRGRTLKDVMGPMSEVASAPMMFAARSASLIIATDFLCKSDNIISTKDRADIVRDYLGEVELFHAATKDGPKDVKRLLQRATVMAVALVTLRYQPEEATVFWKTVAEDESRNGSVEKSLIRWLRNHKATGATGQMMNVGAAASAWNMFYERRAADRITPLRQFKLLGTPYGGKP